MIGGDGEVEPLDLPLAPRALLLTPQNSLMIQLDCPHCKATLRVPDAAMGQTGPCPRCGKPVLVPIPPQAQTPAAAPTTPPVGSVTPPAATAPPPQPTSPANTEGYLEQLAAEGRPNKSNEEAVGELFQVLSEPDQHRLDEDPLRRVVAQRRQSSSSFLTGTIFVLLTIIALYFLYDYLNPKMRGQMQGTLVSNGSIPLVVIKQNQIGDLEAFQQYRQEHGGDRININSRILRTSIVAREPGIEISVEPGPTTQLVRVDVLQNKPLRDYHRERFASFDRPRKEIMNKGVVDFLRAVNETESVLRNPTMLREFRDRFVLPACVSGLGYRLTAETGGIKYPCIWQDKEDRLYFAVPGEATSFTIIERELASQPRVFPKSLQFEVSWGATGTPSDNSSDDVIVEPLPEETLPEMTSEIPEPEMTTAE